MTAQISSVQYWATSLDGVNFTPIPQDHNGFQFTDYETFDFADTTSQYSGFRKLTYPISASPKDWYLAIQETFRVASQRLWLSYESERYYLVAGVRVPYFYAGTATFSKKPQGKVNGPLVENVVLEFEMVEWLW
jgi:hypothetical protein